MLCAAHGLMLDGRFPPATPNPTVTFCFIKWTSALRHDGRPPDTSKQLLASPKKKKGKLAFNLPQSGRIPSYIWSENSCWLDTSLDLLFHAVSRNYARGFDIRMSPIFQSEPLWNLYQVIDFRRQLSNDQSNNAREISEAISKQRKGLRKYLLKAGIETGGPNSFSCLFVRNSSLLEVSPNALYYRAGLRDYSIMT